MTDDLEQKPAGKKCNARKSDGSGYCQHSAGWGTDHTGHGRCKFHGGSTEAQEKGLIAELEDAAEDAAVALRLKLKHARQKAEAGDYDDVDWGELDRLARTTFDRTGHGKTETQEVTGDGGGPVEVELNETVVETGYDTDE